MEDGADSRLHYADIGGDQSGLEGPFDVEGHYTLDGRPQWVDFHFVKSYRRHSVAFHGRSREPLPGLRIVGVWHSSGALCGEALGRNVLHVGGPHTQWGEGR